MVFLFSQRSWEGRPPVFDKSRPVLTSSRTPRLASGERYQTLVRMNVSALFHGGDTQSSRCVSWIPWQEVQAVSVRSLARLL